MDQVFYSILGSAALAILGFVFGRLSIKTKTEMKVEAMGRRIDKTDEDVREVKEAIPIIMQCLLALLVAIKHDKVNGECDKALDQLNEYLIKK